MLRWRGWPEAGKLIVSELVPKSSAGQEARRRRRDRPEQEDIRETISGNAKLDCVLKRPVRRSPEAGDRMAASAVR
jgi:hypothetical protein